MRSYPNFHFWILITLVKAWLGQSHPQPLSNICFQHDRHLDFNATMPPRKACAVLKFSEARGIVHDRKCSERMEFNVTTTVVLNHKYVFIYEYFTSGNYQTRMLSLNQHLTSHFSQYHYLIKPTSQENKGSNHHR